MLTTLKNLYFFTCVFYSGTHEEKIWNMQAGFRNVYRYFLSKEG